LKKIKQYPVFVKPKQGAGGVNSFVAINADILANGLKRLVDLQGNGNNLYDEILVQELIMGDEYVVNTFSEDGEHYVVEV
jgi:biotin carboxylase